MLLCSAVVAATNILLRTGSAFAAMLFAAMAGVLVGTTTLAQGHATIEFMLMATATAAVSGLALYLAAVRFGHPSTW